MALTSLLTALALVPQSAPASVIEIRGDRATPLVIGQTTRRVTLRFENASLRDVLKRLEREKIDFAVDPDSFRDRKVTLSLTDVPLTTALDAIADALGAHWEPVGTVRVLKKGAATRMPLSGMFDNGSFRTFTLPAMPNFDPKGQQEALKALAAAQKELAKAQGMSEEQRKTAIKALEEAQKSLSKSQFALPNGSLRFQTPYPYRSLSPQENEEFRKAMERIRGNQFRSVPGLKIDGSTDALILGKSNSVTIKANGNAPTIARLGTLDFDALFKSLTTEQKELSKKQGYLKVSDLTEEQRKQVSIQSGSKFEIAITREGETIKIKGD